MKKWLLYAAVLAMLVLLGNKGNVGADVGELEPVQLITLEQKGGRITLTTDTGHVGVGNNVADALENMKKTASGKIFLDTADYLLIKRSVRHMIEELYMYLRPSCAVCEYIGVPNLTEAAQYLQYHAPHTTIGLYEAGQRDLPQLICREGRMELAQ